MTATTVTTAGSAGSSSGRWEQMAGSVLPVALGAGVFAVAFVHVHDVAEWAGQPGWASYLIAMTGEAMAIAALAAINSRRRIPGAKVGWPVFVLVAAVLFSGACNLAAVTHRPRPDDPSGAGPIAGQPGHWVVLMAVWPVVAFGLVAGLKATKPGHGAPPIHTGPQTASTTSTTPAPAVRTQRSNAGAGGTSPHVEHTPYRAPDITPVDPPAAPAAERVTQVTAAEMLAASWARVGEDTGDGGVGGHIGEYIAAGDDRPVLARATNTAHTDPFDLPVLPLTAAPEHDSEAGFDIETPLALWTPADRPTVVPPSLTPSPVPVPATLPAAPVAAVFRAPTTPPEPTAVDGLGDPGDPDVSDLLPDSRKVRDALAEAEMPLNRKTLHAGLKEYGHKAGTRRLDAVLKILRDLAAAQ